MLKLIKLHLSSLFKRKAEDMFSLGNNVFIFTKIEKAGLVTKNYDTELPIHKVTVINEDLMNALMLALPHINTRGAFTNLKKFLGIVNKASNKAYKREELDLYDLSLYDKNIETFCEVISIPNKNKINIDICVVDPEKSLRATVSSFVEEETIVLYENEFKEYGKIKSTVITKAVEDTIKNGGIRFDNQTGILFYDDGTTTVSSKEYVKKVDDSGEYTFLSLLIDECHYTKSIYKNKYVKVETIQPAIKIFK